MGHHAYKSICTPVKDEQLHSAIQPKNVLDKYAVAVKRKESQVVDHLSWKKSRKLGKTVFYFLKASEVNDCIAVVYGKPDNQGDGKGLKVSCTLQFTAEEKFIKILKDQLETSL